MSLRFQPLGAIVSPQASALDAAAPAVDATVLLLLAAATLAFLAVGFLLWKTAAALPRAARPLRTGSGACVAIGAAALALAIAEAAFRIAAPGGYFLGPPRSGAMPDAMVERLPDGQAYWEYRGTHGFDELGYRGGFVAPAADLSRPVAGRTGYPRPVPPPPSTGPSPMETMRGYGVAGADAPGAVGAEFRVVVLGDSVAFGVRVEMQEAFPFLLRGKLQDACGKTLLYDLATPGYSTIQQRISLERKGLAGKPHLVLVAAVPNDVEQYTFLGNAAYDIRVRDADGIPVFRFFPLPDSVNRFLVVHSVLYQWATLKGMQVQDRADGRYAGQVEATAAEMEKIRVLTAGAGAQLVVALLPMLDMELSRPEADSRVYSYEYFDLLRNWARDASVPVIDMRPLLAPCPLDDIRIDAVCHLSPNGHRIVADLLARELQHLGLLPDRCEATR